MKVKQRSSDNAGSEIPIKIKWKLQKKQLTVGIFGTVTIQETLDLQSEEFSEDKSVNINKECSCDEKDEDVTEEVALAKNLTLKELRDHL